MIFERDDLIPVVSRLVSNNITRDVFGKKTTKVKLCEQCCLYRPYSDYYTKPGFQNLNRESISEIHLRSICVACFDFNNKHVYRLGSRPKPVYTATLDKFFCDEVDNA